MSSLLFDSYLNSAISDNKSDDIDLQKALDMSDMIRSQTVTDQQAKSSVLRSLRQYPAFNSNNKNKVYKLWQVIQILMMNSGLTFIKHFYYNLDFLKLLQQHISTVEEKRLTGQLEDYKDLRDCVWKIFLDLKVYGGGKPIPPFTNINRILEPLEDKNCYPPKYLVDAEDSFEDLCKKFDAKTPGEWIESEFCLICNNQFGIFNRKHHCRNCGGVFCNDHSSHFIQLLDLGITEKVRVCDDCYKLYTDKGSGGKKRRKSKHTKKSSSTNEDFDEDLKKAIELSLKESQEMERKQNIAPRIDAAEREFQTDDEIELPEEYRNEDEEFKKAIEMSIKEDKRRARDARRELNRLQESQPETSVTPQPEPIPQPQNNQTPEIDIDSLVKKMQGEAKLSESASVEDAFLKAQRLKELIEKETNELERKYQMLQNLNQQVQNPPTYSAPLERNIYEGHENIPKTEVPEQEEDEEIEENPYYKYYNQPVPKLAKSPVPSYVSPEPAAPKNTATIEKRKSVLEQLTGLSFEEANSLKGKEDKPESRPVEEEDREGKHNEKHINNVNFPTVPFVKPPVKTEELQENELEEEEAPMLIDF